MIDSRTLLLPYSCRRPPIMLQMFCSDEGVNGNLRSCSGANRLVLNLSKFRNGESTLFFNKCWSESENRSIGSVLVTWFQLCHSVQKKLLSHGWRFLSYFFANLDRNSICTVEIVVELCTKDEYSLFGSRLRKRILTIWVEIAHPNSEYSFFVQRSITLSDCARYRFGYHVRASVLH